METAVDAEIVTPDNYKDVIGDAANQDLTGRQENIKQSKNDIKIRIRNCAGSFRFLFFVQEVCDKADL